MDFSREYTMLRLIRLFLYSSRNIKCMFYLTRHDTSIELHLIKRNEDEVVVERTI